MVRPDNSHEIIRRASGILSHLTEWFATTDVVPASRVYNHEIMGEQLDSDLCCKILLGLSYLEAPFDMVCEDSTLKLCCTADKETRYELLSDTATWIREKEPSILEAAEKADFEVCPEVLD